MLRNSLAASGRRTGLGAAIAATLFMSVPVAVVAESGWRDPHPQRRDGFVEGREFLYNMESFLHRLSYRQLSDTPAPGEDGLYGTGGSITGDELYLEANLQKTLMLDNGRYGIVARMQRREDFDGRFDRQMLGVKREFSERLSGAFVADISGDKGLVDFQYESTWRPDDSQQLRMVIVQMDRLYNNKGNSSNKYQRTPTTYFAHYQRRLSDVLYGDLAINYSPNTRYEDRNQGVMIRSAQLRIAAGLSFPLSSNWVTGVDIKAERTDRNYDGLPLMVSQGSGDFSRDMQQVTWSIESTQPRRWNGGLRYFRFDEQGWFGQNLATNGHNHRREMYAFAGATVRQRDNNWWEPVLYVGNVDLDRQFTQRPMDNRDSNRIVAKVSTAWRYVIHQQSGAVLTVNPTFRLHSMNFGGGNLQLHWPL
ncbi:MAG: hypothetical protein Q7L19_03845 [Pseudohongiella sp.]|nr:hypothetical protein [Pseudohongiella sp.]